MKKNKFFIICSFCDTRNPRRQRSYKELNFCNNSCQLKYEYSNGIRDKTKIVEKAHQAVIKRSQERFKTNPTTLIGKRGYLLIYIPQKGWKKYHHYVWENVNGKIPKGLHIHHKDENKLNNKINNLQLLTNSEHQKLHPRKRNSSGQFC